uniref:Uncharacterized protein n=1 Tax=Octactis speculum TaxID=3111310 RepID=A0A7S2DI88_9STRA|mmetsp:Transcript_48735/g.66414  ORF Transcript_48735/g.66414 Transcript_48735/m.66414 type:complete len:389 (+) Transcript_48735:2-1168(+)
MISDIKKFHGIILLLGWAHLSFAVLTSPAKVQSLEANIPRREWLQLGGFLAVAMGGPGKCRAEQAQGVEVITASDIGKAVRISTIKGAQFADSVDYKWERFSDSLRDKNQCDPTTGRRMFDNGFRRDGTRIGNPVLGNLCSPQPLRPFDPTLAASLLDTLDRTASKQTGQSEAVLKGNVKELQDRARPAFARAEMGKNEAELERSKHNFEVFTRAKAYSAYISDRPRIKQFQEGWGSSVIDLLASGAGRREFTSPFPKASPEDDTRRYDEGKLLDALGVISVCLRKLESGGLIGRWEIAVPTDDDGEVVTIAVDDDVTLGGQIFLREETMPLSGAVVEAIVTAALKRSDILFRSDSFFLDPSTTRQEVYEPTQLLLSLANLRTGRSPQ